MLKPSFGSIFLAGFECSTQRRWDGQRVDALEATGHFRFCDSDYALAKKYGLNGGRDGLRWHLVGSQKGNYDWSSALPMLKAAKSNGMTVIWDLCHYGYPDWLDIWSDAFLDEFARYTVEAVRLIRQETGQTPMICPVNEISFWAWLGGQEGKINPHSTDRAHELKRQLVRAKLVSIAAAREVDPETVVVSAEPLIHVIRDTNDEEDVRAAAAYHNAQFQAVDLTLGLMEPELGGRLDAIDVIGVNYYPHNQWRIRGGYVPLGHHDYRPLSKLLEEVWERYKKPLFIAETGCENSARPAWMSYVCQEVRLALQKGVPVQGICLYPITDYRGWDNDRICDTGLFCCADDEGRREVYRPLADELDRQSALFSNALSNGSNGEAGDSSGLFSPVTGKGTRPVNLAANALRFWSRGPTSAMKKAVTRKRPIF